LARSVGRARGVGDLKARQLHATGLDVEALHHHGTLRLKRQEFSRTAGCDDLNALIVGTGIDDYRVAAVQSVRGLLNRFPW